MAAPKLTAPSFALRKGTAHATFSDDGAWLCQVTSRVVVWDVAARKVSSEFKVLKNDHYVAISPDGSTVAVVNTMGTIAFCERSSGRLVSSTKPSPMDNREGCAPYFTRDGKHLVHGDHKGRLRLIEAATAREVDRRDFPGFMFWDGAMSREAGRIFFNLVQVGDMPDRETILASLSDDGALDWREVFEPESGNHAKRGSWREIDRVAASPQGDRLALVMLNRGKAAPRSLEIFPIASGVRSASRALPTSTHTRGLACSRDGMVAVSVREYVPRDRALTWEQWLAVLKAKEYTHVHFYANELQPITRWHWKDCAHLQISPSSGALAITSSEEPGACLADRCLHARSANELRGSPRVRPFLPQECLT